MQHMHAAIVHWGEHRFCLEWVILNRSEPLREEEVHEYRDDIIQQALASYEVNQNGHHRERFGSGKEYQIRKIEIMGVGGCIEL
jgi:hypothetical protein